MNEEIEYAEMLEIPVSTVNVVKKRKRKTEKGNRQSSPLSALQNAANVWQGANAQNPSASQGLLTPSHAEEGLQNPLQDSVIAQVNDRVRDLETPSTVTADADLFAESANSEGTLDLDFPDRIDTVRVYANPKPKRSFFKRRKETQNTADFTIEESFENTFPDFDEPTSDPFLQSTMVENEGGRYETNNPEPRSYRIAMTVEFAAACALCGAIFLTNVFLPGSAINTFFRALHNGSAQTADTRSYADFTLTNVVSELSDTKLTLSETGILSFTDECCVYPAVNGTIREILQAEDGKYLIKISHSDTFSGVISGLDYVYYAVGDEVKSNVPVGFSKGETEVQVTMYSQGELLNCFSLDDENCLVWSEQSEE